MNEKGIDDLPQTVLEHIFFLLRPYGSLNSARQVNSRWRRIIDGSVRYMKRRYSSCKDFSWNEITEKLHNHRYTSYISERGCHAACYSKSDNVMYMFGGSTSKYSPLSDMWKFNMESLEWQRVDQKGVIPSPRSLCTLLDAGEILILFGGYAKSSMNPINQHVQFFGDLYYFIKPEQKWEQIRSDDFGLPKLASHGASMLQNRWMIITGGSSGEDFNGDVYILDLNTQILSSVKCTGEGPSPRHGHCQITVDDHNVLIIGGAGVIKGAYSDVFLLTFDKNIEKAKWKEIKVNNTEFWPPHFWGIRGCRVDNRVVFLSRPHFVNQDKTFQKRPVLTAASSIASSSSGQSSYLLQILHKTEEQ
uniref:F-box domain-containing protein n=1 Tax=Panagrolaimus superbus TaxID=310955 RepID=A0A914Y885_9BILA